MKKNYSLTYFTDNGMSDEDIRRLLPLYLADTRDLMGQMEKARAANNLESLRMAAHKLKTNFAILGIQAPNPVITRLEEWKQDMAAWNSDPSAALLDPLMEAVHESLAGIQKDYL